MSKVKFGQQFFEIRHDLRRKPPESCTNCGRWCKCERNEWYYTIKPVYVYSINAVWDGSETFDVCPVDFSKLANKNVRIVRKVENSGNQSRTIQKTLG